MEQRSTLAPIFKWEDCLQYFINEENVIAALREFKQQLIQDRKDLKIAFKNNDTNRLLFLFIHLLGSSGYCGTSRLYNTLRNLKPIVKNHQLTPIFLERIDEEIDAALSAITLFLDERCDG